MIWFANILLILSMWLLGRKNFLVGWVLNWAGNSIWCYATVKMHRADMWSLSLIFALIATYNFYKTLRESWR